MKVIVIVLGILAAGIGGAVAVKFQLDADNSRAAEMRKKDIEAMRARAAAGAGQMQSSPLHWGGADERK